jgi:hypothetical protein
LPPAAAAGRLLPTEGSDVVGGADAFRLGADLLDTVAAVAVIAEAEEDGVGVAFVVAPVFADLLTLTRRERRVLWSEDLLRAVNNGNRNTRAINQNLNAIPV